MNDFFKDLDAATAAELKETTRLAAGVVQVPLAPALWEGGQKPADRAQHPTFQSYGVLVKSVLADQIFQSYAGNMKVMKLDEVA